METNKIYCINCDEEVDYITKEETKKVIVKGREFEVTLKRAYCATCGEPVSPDKIAKENDLIVFDTYRRLEGLLTSDQIKAIRFKRGLSQTALARLINCGEKNIARYETGTIQDKAFDLLMRLVDDDTSYAVLRARQNKENNRKTIFVLVKEYDNLSSSITLNENHECEYDYKKGGNKDGYRIKTQQVLCN